MLLALIGTFFLFHHLRKRRKASSRCKLTRNYIIENQRRQEKAYIDYQKRQQQQILMIEKRRQQKEEASSDLKYFISRMDDLQAMVWLIDSQLEAARKNLEIDRSMNQYGAVVSEKTISDHIKAFTKLQKEALTIENQIHALEKKIARAQYILAS